MYNQHKRRKDKHLFADISFFFYRNLFLLRLQLSRKKILQIKIIIIYDLLSLIHPKLAKSREQLLMYNEQSSA